MSRLLSIDSSIPQGSVALLESTRILSQKLISKDLPSSKSLLSAIDHLFQESRTALWEVEGFCVTTGPGSFTGLRVGISLVKGLILGTGKPFLGIGSLEAIAAQVDPCEHLICPVLDARKKEVYTATFKYQGKHLIRQTPDEALPPETLADRIQKPTLFIGQGMESYGNYLSQRLGSKFILAGTMQINSSAASGGILASRRFDIEKKYNLNELRINYIRRPEAETQKQR